MIKFFSLKNNLILYFVILSVATVFFLYVKHEALTDSSMSDWMINYQGGFTRRGVIGEIFFQLGLKLDIHIRFLIFIFQCTLYLIFYYLLFNYLKDIKISYLLILAIFSPLFILYPVAELESLGRKEIVLLITFLTFCIFLNKQKNKVFLLYFLFILPIVCLIWEGIIFFYSYFLAVFLLNFKNRKILNFFTKVFFFLIPTFFIIFIISYFKHTNSEYDLMCRSLEFFYNQKCYMALTYTTGSLNSNMGEVASLFSFFNLFRFIMIFVIGFFPLLLLSYCVKIDNHRVHSLFFDKLSFFQLFLIVIIPNLILFLIAIDWGRWMYISYSMSIIFFIYCLKSRFIVLDNQMIYKKFDFIQIKNKSILILVFIIFAFSWNHKTVMHEDIGSIPIYRIFTKMIKWRNIFDLKNIDISRTSEKYISSGSFFEDK